MSVLAEPHTRRRIATAFAAALAVGLVVVAAIAGRSLLRGPQAAAAPPVPLGAALDPPAPAEALVFVSGAVGQPGLYRLPATAHVADAVAAAGGLTAEADPGRLPDLAATVHDGRQYNVPFRNRSAAAAPARVTDRLDVNTATLAELRGVPGMPLGLAEAIVDARGTVGGFSSLSDVRTLLAVDAPTFGVIRPWLRAGDSTR